MVIKIIGLMSGTSLDGLDICYTQFNYDEMSCKWSYEILAAEDEQYPEVFKASACNSSEYDCRGVCFA